jgi:predicted NAD-dependent protein-ADP-ribosyltransferase YbiA (DUF1768 family)
MKDMFVFYSKSTDGKPGKNKGVGWTEYIEDESMYKDLEKIKEWRKTLSNFYESPFILDDKEWNTVEHYFHAVKFRDLSTDKKNKNYNFYKTFALNSKSPWSVEPNLAKQAGKAGRVSKNGKVYDKKIGNEKIPKDVKLRSDFYEGIDKKTMTIAFLAKFTQNPILEDILLKTGNAELYHIITERGKTSKLQLWDHLMRVRECIRKFKDIYVLSELSKLSPEIIDKILR